MNEISLRDFYAAAFLIAKGHKLKSHSQFRGVTTFIFEDNDELKKILNEYYTMQASVEPLTYGNAIRTLKTVVHSNKSNYKSNSEVCMYEEHSKGAFME